VLVLAVDLAVGLWHDRARARRAVPMDWRDRGRSE